MLEAVGNWIRESQIWGSIFRHGIPRDRRTRAMAVLSNVFPHLHPVAVRKSGIRLSFTWCMGGLTFFLFLVEIVTGVLHRWGAHAMIITIWLHMLRVFLTGSYKPPREFNWSVGVILLVLTLLLSFTGYLLPWDQLAMWAITVGSNMARATPGVGTEGPLSSFLQIGGVPLVRARADSPFRLHAGTFVGPNALLRFYVLHCVFIPVVVTVLLAVHFWRVRKDGGISGPL